VRVEDCDRPGLLGGVAGVDLFGVTEAEARSRLAAMVAHAVAGVARPDTGPAFPGQAFTREPRFPGALPQVWNVPARNPNFTGRAADLRRIADGLAVGPAVTVAAVRGMGGVGKTTLANEYAHVHATDYELVWWVAAEEPTSIPDQFARLADQLGLDPDADRLAAQVHQRLRDVAGWLLVFDNAVTADGIRPWLPPSLLPDGVPGHVVVTTRRRRFGELGAVLDLDVIEPAEAVALMRKRVGDLDEAVAGRIAEELGRLPLAVEQAAAYLDRSAMPGATYLRLLKERAEAVYAGTAAEATIASLWDLSLDSLAEEVPAAAQLLDVCAYLAPEAVPLDLFTAHPEQLPDPLATAVTDELAFAGVVAAIVDYSLAKRSSDHAGDGLQLHRLVQGALRARHRRATSPIP
jgi:hypothetical protein